MTSQRQIEANRANAKRSTGPKTAGGKARSSQNAVRHGLARRGSADGADVEKLVAAIASGFGHQIASESVTDLAHSKLELARIRSLRQGLLVALLEDPVPAGVKRLKNLERYERAALVKQKRALRAHKIGGG
jgi:hypothetical protein